ncbi:PRC-barrel domain containing protein [Planctobacterium marinum]|uniref:PRC-barrel domain containing protein n=1 Tax=Planctobacterium marinum TaxID=1631968 RepID=UPI001E53D036|nr:PRC-barrel domain containing protein [Planctobacterium marinum]MCC2606740.1 PRC-barrel domain containing protein [Planctobacterium marinum]
MLLSVNSLRHYAIQASDGAIGECHDLLFDDRFWTCRFLTVDTHPWLPLSHKVLISPVSINNVVQDDEKIHVDLTKEQVKSAPSTDTNEPVSREFEREYFNYFGFGHYWVGPGAWGEYAYPTDLVKPPSANARKAEQKRAKYDNANHLRSVKEIQHYLICGTDDAECHVHDFVLNTDNWSIAYLVLDTRDWFPGGRKVFMLPEQIEEISWADQALKTSLSDGNIKNLPEYHGDSLNDTDYLQEVANTLKSVRSEKSERL